MYLNYSWEWEGGYTENHYLMTNANTTEHNKHCTKGRLRC